MIDDDTDLRALLATLDPKARGELPRVLIREHADRDAIASQLLRHDENGKGWADIIDLLSIYPDTRRRVVRALGELTAETDPQTSRTPKRAVCLVTLSVATEAQVKGHMCWSSAFDPFRVRR
jgi:hypothetical protein